MTVQELFQSINEEEFIESYLRNDNETIECLFRKDISINEIYQKINFFKEVVLGAFRRFKEMEVERNDEYIVFAIPRYDGDTYADSFLSLREEISILKTNKAKTELLEKENKDLKELLNIKTNKNRKSLKKC